MERILRGVIQVGGLPDAEDAHANWLKLQEHPLEYRDEEDKRIHDYLKSFYGQMSSAPDLLLVKEYFEKLDAVEVVDRLSEVSKAQLYIRTNYLSIVRSEQEQQQIKNLVLLCRDTTSIAEHGRVVDPQAKFGKPRQLRGPNDAVNYLYEHLHEFARTEGGEKLEGVVSDDADEVLDEYELVQKTNRYANRNLFGLEPVDSICKGHRRGELWVHTAFAGELKCLSGSASIYDHSAGRRRTVQEVYESRDRPTVTALYKAGERPKLVQARASRFVQNGIRPVYDLVLESGRRTRATSNHGFLGLHGWVELRDLSPGDWVAVPRQTRVSDPVRDFTDAEVKAIGYLIGDGTVSRDIWLTASNEEIREDFKACLVEMGYVEKPADFSSPNFRTTIQKDRAPGVRVSHASGAGCRPYVSRLRVILEQLSLYGKVAHTKMIPDELFGLSDHQVSVLLGALWSTDGSIHVGDHERSDRNCLDSRNDLKYYSVSEKLCLGVQALLLRLGIRSTVSAGKVVWKGEEKTVHITRVIGSRSKRVFCDLVSVVGKDWRLDLANGRLREEDDTPYPKELVPDGASAVVGTGNRRYRSQMTGRTVEASVLEHFRHVHRISRELDGDILWERVVSVTLVGEEMTYDLEVPEHHSFVVDDIVSHNTTLALNYAYNNVMLYGKNIFYAILEMPYTQLRRQLYVIHSSNGKFVTDWHKEDGYTGIDYRKVRDGELSERDLKRLKIVAQDFKATAKGKLYVWRPREQVGVEEIRRKAEMFHNKYGCDGMVVDHLGLAKAKKRYTGPTDSLNEVVMDSRLVALNFARGTGVPVLALFQLNRQGKLRADKSDGHYDFAAIAYANEVERSADVVTYTYLNDVLRREGKFYMGCLKNRDNPIFERMTGKVLWQSKRMRALESGLLDLSADQIVSMSRQLSELSIGDIVAA